MSIGRHEKPVKGATDIWLTPLWITNALGPFDLDPCGEQHHRTAKTIYSENGLEKKWFGKVWLNPPYSEVGVWVNRLAEHGCGIALVFARTETKWAQEVLPKATSVFFLKGRIKFLTVDLEEKGNAGAPSMFLSFGLTPDWFRLGEGICFERERRGRR